MTLSTWSSWCNTVPSSIMFGPARLKSKMFQLGVFFTGSHFTQLAKRLNIYWLFDGDRNTHVSPKDKLNLCVHSRRSIYSCSCCSGNRSRYESPATASMKQRAVTDSLKLLVSIWVFPPLSCNLRICRWSGTLIWWGIRATSRQKSDGPARQRGHLTWLLCAQLKSSQKALKSCWHASLMAVLSGWSKSNGRASSDIGAVMGSCVMGQITPSSGALRMNLMKCCFVDMQSSTTFLSNSRCILAFEHLGRILQRDNREPWANALELGALISIVDVLIHICCSDTMKTLCRVTGIRKMQRRWLLHVQQNWNNNLRFVGSL